MTQKPKTFVTTISADQSRALRSLLEEQSFAFSQPPYSSFSGKKKGLSITLYESGKLVVQGKEMKEFIEFYLEPQILKTFEFTHPHANLDRTGRIGQDESGKGDYFGPLVITGVYAAPESIETLCDIGVTDSKRISDERIPKLASDIKKLCQHKNLVLSPTAYNRLYQQFGNLNHMMAWAHSKVLVELFSLTNAQKAIIDQFAHESLVKRFLQGKAFPKEIIQVPRAESDPVVAAASILARDRFLNELHNLSEKYAIQLPKGASQLTIQAGQQFVSKYGKEQLVEVAKLHFQTTQKITH